MPFYIQPDNPTVLPWITDVSRLFCVFRFPSVISNECSISWRHDSEVKFRLHIVSSVDTVVSTIQSSKRKRERVCFPASKKLESQIA